LQELQHVGGVVDMGAGAGGFAGAGGDAGNISDGSVGAVPDTGGCGVVAARHPDHGFGQGGGAAEMRGLFGHGHPQPRLCRGDRTDQPCLCRGDRTDQPCRT